MTTEEIIDYTLKATAGGGFGLLLYFVKDFVGQVKTLTVALQTNASETQKLSALVSRLDQENSSLRRSHDALTRYLIGRGILPTPDPEL
jgi:cell division protein FtsB